jgi:hypothetical protein
LEWIQIQYPKQLDLACYHHPGFNREDAVELVTACQGAGVTMISKILPPQPKIARGYYEQCSFGYPYRGYEEYCREYDCDITTGN